LSTTGYNVRQASWTREHEQLHAIRNQVFVKEQGVPPELELDEKDPDAFHILARSDTEEPVGTGRILQSGQIGRMAVLPQWRGKGVGKTILQALLDHAVGTGMKTVFLNAQIQAVPFYQSHGFVVTGDEFMDAGIPHLRMELSDNG
jgi:predicted GNAT family N-acyltransferase